jgi:hypothetical protein
MPNPLPDLDLDLADLPEGEWLARLAALAEEHGFARPLGPHHHALFIEAGPRLLVTFESIDQARRNPGALPRGLDQVTRNGWSLLSLLSRGDTWFRDPAVFRSFDRWTDEGFLEDFERVLFVGSGAGGYAASAFSVAAPGSRVLALRPYATLDPAVAGWDRRHPAARRRDWTSRYGYAPAMLDAADRAAVLHDPTIAADAMHASLFTRANVVSLRVPHTGSKLDTMLDGMAVLPLLMDLAMESALDAPAFARLWRNRRHHAPYLRALLRHLEAQGRRGLAARVCHFGLDTVDRPLFARKLAELNALRARPQAPAAGQPAIQAAE